MSPQSSQQKVNYNIFPNMALKCSLLIVEEVQYQQACLYYNHTSYTSSVFFNVNGALKLSPVSYTREKQKKKTKKNYAFDTPRDS